MLFVLFTPSWWKTRKDGWRSQPIGAIPKATLPRWLCWILDPQSLSFRFQETAIPTARKCDFFLEVFSPPSPKFFLLICVRASALPWAPFPPVSPCEIKRGISYGVSNSTLRHLFCANYSTFSLIFVALRQQSACSVGNQSCFPPVSRTCPPSLSPPFCMH
jgi:hypothetical protein